MRLAILFDHLILLDKKDHKVIYSAKREMRRLADEFILKHLDEQLLLAVNKLYWLGTRAAKISYVLEKGEYPAFSKDFYSIYGYFSPVAPFIVLDALEKEECTLTFIEENIGYENYFFDLVNYIRFNRSDKIKMKIIDAFFENYDYICEVDSSYRQWVAVKRMKMGDTRMYRFFKAKSYLEILHRQSY